MVVVVVVRGVEEGVRMLICKSNASSISGSTIKLDKRALTRTACVRSHGNLSNILNIAICCTPARTLVVSISNVRARGREDENEGEGEGTRLRAEWS